MPCKSQTWTDVVQLQPGLAAEARRLPLRPRFRLLPQAGQRACPTWGAGARQLGRSLRRLGGGGGYDNLGQAGLENSASHPCFSACSGHMTHVNLLTGELVNMQPLTWQVWGQPLYYDLR